MRPAVLDLYWAAGLLKSDSAWQAAISGSRLRDQNKFLNYIACAGGSFCYLVPVWTIYSSSHTYTMLSSTTIYVEAGVCFSEGGGTYRNVL